MSPARRAGQAVPFSPVAGGCACGSIRYELVSEPLTVYACHCTDCQTETGASFTLSMYVEKDAVRLSRGEPRLRAFRLPDGRERRPVRCEECDVALWCLSERLPELLNLQPGTLDDTSWVHPVAHIFVRSRQPWVEIPPFHLSYDGSPDEIRPLVQAWRDRSR